MMTVHWRDDFPRGWWRSPAWWGEGLVELVVRVLIGLAGLVMVSRVIRALHHYDDPPRLRKEADLMDAWATGALIAGVVLAIVAWVSAPFDPMISPALAGLMIVLCAGNLLVDSFMVILLCRSRLDHPTEWAMIDFVEKNAPRNGRPPETVDEYDALRLQRQLS